MPRDPGDDLDPVSRDWQQQIRVQNAELWEVCVRSGVMRREQHGIATPSGEKVVTVVESRRVLGQPILVHR